MPLPLQDLKPGLLFSPEVIFGVQKYILHIVPGAKSLPGTGDHNNPNFFILVCIGDGLF
jgi:hypothetical protein